MLFSTFHFPPGCPKVLHGAVNKTGTSPAGIQGMGDSLLSFLKSWKLRQDRKGRITNAPLRVVPGQGLAACWSPACRGEPWRAARVFSFVLGAEAPARLCGGSRGKPSWRQGGGVGLVLWIPLVSNRWSLREQLCALLGTPERRAMAGFLHWLPREVTKPMLQN